MSSPEVAVVIPAYNEAGFLGRTLDSLNRMGASIEIIVVDGQSCDSTIDVARGYGVTVLTSARGRGTQMHAGACAASASVLWFVHADTVVPADSIERIRQSLHSANVAGGNFGLHFDGSSRGARQLTVLYPWLRRLGLCYGDSGIFVRRQVYREIGGFRPYPIFEDIDLVRNIKRHGRFVHLACNLTTSARRFEGRNFAGMFVHWFALQALYWMGVSPFRLSRWYPAVRGARNQPAS